MVALRFVIARLLIDALPSTVTPNTIRKHLSQLPSDLPETYRLTMKRIKEQEPSIAEIGLKTIAWVYFAKDRKRPLERDQIGLTIEELRHAVSFRPGMKTLSQDDLVTEDQILSACAGLIVFTNERCHFSRRYPIPSLAISSSAQSDATFDRPHDEGVLR